MNKAEIEREIDETNEDLNYVRGAKKTERLYARLEKLEAMLKEYC